MTKRKYTSYTLVTDEESDVYTIYLLAFFLYQKADSATLYGTDEQGEMSVIMSK